MLEISTSKDSKYISELINKKIHIGIKEIFVFWEVSLGGKNCLFTFFTGFDVYLIGVYVDLPVDCMKSVVQNSLKE